MRRCAALLAGAASALALAQATGATFAAFDASASASATYTVATVSPAPSVSGSCLLGVVTVSWTEAAGRVDGYQLQWSGDGTTYSDVGDVLPATARSTTDVRLLGTHHYRVRTVAGSFFADSAPVVVACL